MKQIESSILYGRVTIHPSVPTTVEEIDKLVGEPNAAVDGFNSDCSARNFLPRLYSKVSNELASRFPVKASGKTAKITKKVKDPTTGAETETTEEKPVNESDIKHVGRVWEENESERANITSLLQKYSNGADAIPFYAESERGGGKISDKLITAANELSASPEKAKLVASKIEATVPGYVVEVDAETGNPTAAGLARGMSAVQRHIQEQQKQQMATLMATE